jgi:peptidyl-prolyl cis-trans isomerase B (cyclophilin B)
VHADYPSLNGNYASFGYVISGMDVVDAIATVPTYITNDKPKENVVIEWIKFANVEEGIYTVPDSIFDPTVSTGGNESESDSSVESETHAPHDAPAYADMDFSQLSSLDGVTESETPTDYVLIDVADHGKMLVRLYPDVAPATVENFKTLVSEKYYDGLIFHRVIKDFMIQGGNGESVKNISGEFAANDFINSLKHLRGVVSMARAQSANSASSQFFICHKTSPHLDGQYAAFGFVVYGLDVIDSVAAVSTDSNDKPVTDVVINSIRFVNVGQ